MPPRRVAVAFSVALALGAADASAFALKRTSTGALVRWRTERIVLAVAPSVDGIAGGRDAVEASAGSWSGAGGGPELETVAGDEPAGVGLDGTNTVAFAADGFAPAAGALAVTIVSYDERTGAILDADIVLNGEHRLASLTRGQGTSWKGDADRDARERAAARPKLYDVAWVVAHEIGHALGLSDEPGRSDALMYPYVAPMTAVGEVPAADDVLGVAALYGADAGPPPVGCEIVAARASGPRWAALGGVAACAALLALRAARRPRWVAGVAASAAAALVVPPAIDVGTTARAASAPLEAARVVSVRTTVDRGLFRSELTLQPEVGRGAALRAWTWGGVLGNVRQEVGGGYVPREGERVGLVREGRPPAERLVPASWLPVRGTGVKAISRLSEGTANDHEPVPRE